VYLFHTTEVLRSARSFAFETFAAVDMASAKITGTGLGLATCHAIVAEHGGPLDVESEPGQGTRMIVSIPRQR
jgi:signal transduction histidine kinase